MVNPYAIILTIARRILAPNENGTDIANPSLKLEPTSFIKNNGNVSDDSLERSNLKQNGISRLTQLTDLDEIQKNAPGLPRLQSSHREADWSSLIR
ncbi:hypothetical protein CEXT_523351 [Caerostris extrusa]|uniref:Uncharacterized protein n=1 Tax=Caerostris extrusa TaxID=172846 RepID=A0AAV4NUF4_CAEEX|nr:hypothetical protein CEXT_523351 [Caerostris extrusa]